MQSSALVYGKSLLKEQLVDHAPPGSSFHQRCTPATAGSRPLTSAKTFGCLPRQTVRRTAKADRAARSPGRSLGNRRATSSSRYGRPYSSSFFGELAGWMDHDRHTNRSAPLRIRAWRGCRRDGNPDWRGEGDAAQQEVVLDDLPLGCARARSDRYRQIDQLHAIALT